MPPIIDNDNCNGCGRCVDVCQMDVFFETEKKGIPVISYPEECWHCNACVLECPTKAVKLRIPPPMMICFK